MVEIDRLVKQGAALNARDGNGRTPMMVAAFRQDDAAVRALIEAGADVNALDNQSYDVITIAAVLNDLDTLRWRSRPAATRGPSPAPTAARR